MARLRTVDLWDVASREGPASSLDQSMGLVHEHYSASLSESGLVGPSSRIDVSLHWTDKADRQITALAYCDNPDGSELITAVLPRFVAGLSDHEQALLLCDVVDAGTKRLAEARQWDLGTVDALIRSARLAVAGPSAPASSGFDVTAAGRGVSAPEQPHEMVFIGGGPTNGVPGDYLPEVERLLEYVTSSDEWFQWWARSPVKIAEIVIWFDAERVGPRVRVGRKVSADVWRPVKSMRGTDPVALAREDVSALTRRLAERLELGAPPSLPQD
ncbi:hypothetical protein [Janibacter sp. UYMM211]|uniref:hypothetical protein n=1 Tax=Janibacter sp. UYMM211 TaxID=3156342 RepID=UPI00339515B9